jgi:NAD(P)-dependent dehydrogenase (short-subunit alcohol dehydrogenase family)
MDLNLRGRIAFITGANRGIGLAISRGMAAEGVRCALFGRDLTATEAAAAAIRHAKGAEAAAFRLDLTDAGSIADGVDRAIRHFGAVDILVNCAGGATRGVFEDIPDDEWEACFAVKPLGLIRMTRTVLPHLEQSDQGRIINIAGTRGREPSPVSSVSGPINFATLSITKVMANALGKKGITVNAVNPGSTDSRRWQNLVEVTMKRLNVGQDEATRHLLQEVPLGKIVKVEDVADIAVFLASARAAMISGMAINVDGGRTRSI